MSRASPLLWTFSITTGARTPGCWNRSSPRSMPMMWLHSVPMDDATRKEVLVAYQKRKQEEILHPFLQEKVAFGLTPHVQAMVLARFVRGDLDGYPPFLWK